MLPAVLSSAALWLQDCIQFGNSSREYVLLHEGSTADGE